MYGMWFYERRPALDWHAGACGGLGGKLCLGCGSIRGGKADGWHANAVRISFFSGSHFVRTARAIGCTWGLGSRKVDCVSLPSLPPPLLHRLARFDRASCLVWNVVGLVVFPLEEPPPLPSIINETPSRPHASEEEEVAEVLSMAQTKSEPAHELWGPLFQASRPSRTK